MRLLKFLHPACRRRPFTVNSLYPNFITRGPVTPVGPVTVTDALLLLLLVFCDICSSSLSLSVENLTPLLFKIFITTFKMEDQRGIIIEERGKTIDIIFIDAKQDGGKKDKSKKKVSIIIKLIVCIDTTI